MKPDIRVPIGRQILYVPDRECWCVCHGYDAANRIKTGGHWGYCTMEHREKHEKNCDIPVIDNTQPVV